MRLVHCVTKKIKEFAQDVPQYAILSHTWEVEELSFALLSEHGPSRLVTKRKGWSKIDWACEQAIEDGLEYVWVDTVCIDKTSSVELSEAINSMYDYYKNASACYVYLFDVCSHRSEEECPTDQTVPFDGSRWFTRGWTLQELIAPLDMMFFDHHWNHLVTKTDALTELTKITGIDELFLYGGNLRLASIARIMSWASRRETTRKEDQAYSLLGLFGISMPMLYGEGDAAFIRLQKMLIETYDDQSVFAWDWPSSFCDAWWGVLAPAPSFFRNSGNIIPVSALHDLNELPSETAPATLTSRGVLFHACALHTTGKAETVGGLLQLRCVDIEKSKTMGPTQLGYASVRRSLETKGGDLAMDELSHSVEYQQDGLRINACVYQSDIGGAYNLSIFAHPHPVATA
ncbi:hypothetical protein SCUCBS95973_004724 [Sporothrix curviconia]|uniref:Heterokaryon incompatibility domain-containing protein n=1 Tax=Sporothrix curviconia TaxID=1260050 RepID=A0ABP0BR36_9PEZI